MAKYIGIYYLCLASFLVSCQSSNATNANNDVQWYKPSVSTTWQWQLKGVVNTSYNVQVYDIDLFDSSKSLIQQIQGSEKKVICYFSAGSYENWRPDITKFNTTELGNPLAGWAGERWLDIRSSNVRSIMKDRLLLAKNKGCDAVEPDNMDGYTNNSGFNLTATDQLSYNQFIATEAHQLGLSVGLKNDLNQINRLVGFFDFAVNEQCFQYNECNLLKPFITQGKPVFNAEYNPAYVNITTARQAMCNQSLALKFSTLILPLNLDDTLRLSCL